MFIFASMETHISIKSLSENDRPREKFVNKGRTALSDSELIAILIGSGSRKETAVQRAQRILASCSNNLDALGRITIEDVKKFKGIGEAKAITIAAALELGRRRKESVETHKVKITSSADAFNILSQHLIDLPHEEFWTIFLDRANQVLKIQKLTSGGISGTVVDQRFIFKMAMDHFSSSIILAHNHPSGNLKPSQQDVHLTNKLRDAGKLLDITVHDHLILAGKSYFSFADEGMI